MKYNINVPLTDEVIYKINNLPDNSTIIFKNTKGLTSTQFKKIKPTIKIRIIGGLDEVEKPKYNAQHYYDRTMYTTTQVVKILEIFEKIESKIKPDWTDLDKTVYIYKTLVENMEYDYDGALDNTDHNRNLCGVLYKLSVCAGFGMIYKEFMDRLGIECLYQNRQHHHAWNVIKINGEYYPIDLTWDVNAKGKDNKCKFKYFASDPFFFKDPGHKGTDELEIPSNTLPKSEIDKSLSKIAEKKVKIQEGKTYINSQVKKIEYYLYKSNGYNQLFLIYDGKLKTVLFRGDEYLDFLLNYDYSTSPYDCIIASNQKSDYEELNNIRSTMKIITRDDGSQLYIKDSLTKKEEVEKYNILKYSNNMFYLSNIYSEENIINENNIEKNRFVNNVLLSDSRIHDKIDRFGGYVGRVRNNYGRYEKVIYKDTEELFSGIRR